MLNLRQPSNVFYDLLFLVPLSAFFMLFGLGNGSLASWDEALYAGVAKEMLLSGNWVDLRWGGSPWADKPPLGMWATALFYKFFGISEFTSRLFSALCGIGTVITTYFIGRKLLNRWIGFLGALVLLSSLHFLRFSRFGMLDAPLTLFLSLALYFFWLGREKNRFLIFSGLMLGLAFMTKSFAAFFIFPVIFIYCVWTGDWSILRRSTYWVGLMVAVLVALPWHLYQMLQNEPMFMREAVLKHLVLRVTTPVDGHIGNYYFYVRTLINKYHPWILIAVFSAPLFLWKSLKEKMPEIVFLTAWMFSIFAVITLVSTKLPWYLMPVYPPLSISVAYVLSRWITEHRRMLVHIAFVGVMVLQVHFMHLFSPDYSPAIKGISSIVKEKVPGGRLYFYNLHEAPASTFYLERQAMYVDTDESFLEAASRENQFYCLIFEKDLARLESHLPELGITRQGAFKDFVLVAKNP